MRELLKQYLTEKQNGCLRSGRLREVVERVDCQYPHLLRIQYANYCIYLTILTQQDGHL